MKQTTALSLGILCVALSGCVHAQTINGNPITVRPVGTSTVGELRFVDLGGLTSHYVGFKAPTSITANLIWQLPAADGAAGQCFGWSSAGVIGWIACAGGGGGGVAGSDKDIQINKTGAFGADTGLFCYDYTNHRLGVGLCNPTSTFQVRPAANHNFRVADGIIGGTEILSSQNSGSLLPLEVYASSTNINGNFGVNTGGSFVNLAQFQVGTNINIGIDQNGGGTGALIRSIDNAGTTAKTLEINGSALYLTGGHTLSGSTTDNATGAQLQVTGDETVSANLTVTASINTPDYIKVYNGASLSFQINGQASNTLQFINSTGTVRAFLSDNGASVITGGSGALFFTPTILATSSDGTAPAIVATAQSGQTADIFDVEDFIRVQKYLSVDVGGDVHFTNNLKVASTTVIDSGRNASFNSLSLTSFLSTTDYIKLYNGATLQFQMTGIGGANSMSWVNSVGTTDMMLVDNGASTVPGGTSAFLKTPAIWAMSTTTNTPTVLINAQNSQTADLLDVEDFLRTTKYFSVDAAGDTHFTGNLKSGSTTVISSSQGGTFTGLTIGSLNGCLQATSGVVSTVACAGGAVASVTGTAGQVTASPTTGAVVVSLPSSVTVTTQLTAPTLTFSTTLTQGATTRIDSGGNLIVNNINGGGAILTGLTIGTLTGCLQGASGVVSATTCVLPNTVNLFTNTNTFTAALNTTNYLKFMTAGSSLSFQMEGLNSNRLDFVNSTGTVRAYLDDNGFSPTGGTSAYFSLPAVLAVPTATTTPGLVVTGANGQTANIFAVQDFFRVNTYLWVDAAGDTHYSGNLKSGSTTVIDGSRNATFAGITTTGNVVANTGIVSTALLVSPAIVATGTIALPTALVSACSAGTTGLAYYNSGTNQLFICNGTSYQPH